MPQLMRNSCTFIFHIALSKTLPFILEKKQLLSFPGTAAVLTLCLLIGSDRFTRSSFLKQLLSQHPLAL